MAIAVVAEGTKLPWRFVRKQVLWLVHCKRMFGWCVRFRFDPWISLDLTVHIPPTYQSETCTLKCPRYTEFSYSLSFDCLPCTATPATLYEYA